MSDKSTKNRKTIQYPAHYSEDNRAKAALVRNWLTTSEQTQAELGRNAGVDDGTMSQVINGKYPTSPTRWLDKLTDAIDRQAERERAGMSDIPFCETSIWMALSRVCKRAGTDRDLGIYYGAVGIGKTTALREYVRRSPSALLVEAFEGIDNSTFVAALVIATSTVVKANASLASKIGAVITNMKARDSVILVDEADYLPDRALGALRRISDIAGIGVVLVGNHELYARVTETKGSRQQLSDRIGFWPLAAERVTSADVAMMVNAYLKGQESPSNDVLKAFETCAKMRARPLRNLLRNAARYAKNGNTTITAKLIHDINKRTTAGHGGL